MKLILGLFTMAAEIMRSPVGLLIVIVLILRSMA